MEVDLLLNELSESTQDLSLTTSRPAKNMFGGSLQHLKHEGRPLVVNYVPVKTGDLEELQMQVCGRLFVAIIDA